MLLKFTIQFGGGLLQIVIEVVSVSETLESQNSDQTMESPRQSVKVNLKEATESDMLNEKLYFPLESVVTDVKGAQLVTWKIDISTDLFGIPTAEESSTVKSITMG